MSGCGIGINAEITLTHKLESVAVPCRGERGIDFTVIKYGKRIRIKIIRKRAYAFLVAWVFNIEQALVKSYFRRGAVRRAYPVKRSFDLSAVGCFAAAAFGIRARIFFSVTCGPRKQPNEL